MKEIVIISGKGGTGKTSIAASFAMLTSNIVIADCDVDAADLHLVLNHKIQHRKLFKSGLKADINPDRCTDCGKCYEICAFDAITRKSSKEEDRNKYKIDPFSCEGCAVCAYFCPAKAINLKEAVCGEWFVSNTHNGPFVHAKLGVAAENSGKLVSQVRQKAKEIAEQNNHDLILVDGPPGTGCPVIASIGGADTVLIITEPTFSGKHDLERVIELAGHFNIPVNVCINKYDINLEIAKEIEIEVKKRGINFAGKIPYDIAITEAQLNGKTVVEYAPESKASSAITNIWYNLINSI